MITVELAGGLGNQLFQYAAGRTLALKHSVPLMLDLSFLRRQKAVSGIPLREYALDIFSLPQEVLTGDSEFGAGVTSRSLRRRWLPYRHWLQPEFPRYYCEHHYRFDARYFSIPSHAYLQGYWQSEDYFAASIPVLRNELMFTEEWSAEAKRLVDRIRNGNSVCLFVRRAEYVTNRRVNEFHGVMDEQYFNQAAALVGHSVQKPEFYIFSDDLYWCQKHLTHLTPATIVEHSVAGRKFGQYLRLMSECRHFIIPNSSFGWWGAWLGTAPDKVVIVPRQWYRDPRMDTSRLTPPEWIRM